IVGSELFVGATADRIPTAPATPVPTSASSAVATSARRRLKRPSFILSYPLSKDRVAQQLVRCRGDYCPFERRPYEILTARLSSRREAASVRVLPRVPRLARRGPDVPPVRAQLSRDGRYRPPARPDVAGARREAARGRGVARARARTGLVRGGRPRRRRASLSQHRARL